MQGAADEGTMGGFRSTSDVVVTRSAVILAPGQRSALNNRSDTSAQTCKLGCVCLCVCVSHLISIKVVEERNREREREIVRVNEREK